MQPAMPVRPTPDPAGTPTAAGPSAAPGQPALTALPTRVDWPSLLGSALRGIGIGVHFQPIVDLVRGTVVGYEALARFDGYPVSDPLEWFAAAHRHGCGAVLESLTLRRALESRGELPADMFLSVNIGPDVITDPLVQAVWNEHPSLSGVIIELTEHARIESYEALEPVLDRLRERGALIALDDAGAGYAGLQHILGIKPHLIKLDRRLIENIDGDETKRALVEMIGSFATRVHAEVLAEGIERAAELDTLVSLGVTMAQGYLLARPGLPWAALDVDTSAHLKLRRSPVTRDSLRLIAEEVVMVRDLPGAREAFAVEAGTTSGGEGTPLVVLVDAESRPLAVVGAHGVRPTDASTWVDQDTTVAHAAHHAVARIPTQRFDPLLCVDDDGRVVGAVPIERVVTYLADTRA
jgi:EAL domain-containing protein (putative c-di-GMP-specific phosphodiesterase class I)